MTLQRKFDLIRSALDELVEYTTDSTLVMGHIVKCKDCKSKKPLLTQLAIKIEPKLNRKMELGLCPVHKKERRNFIEKWKSFESR